jgi:hypothetical protein
MLPFEQVQVTSTDRSCPYFDHHFCCSGSRSMSQFNSFLVLGWKPSDKLIKPLILRNYRKSDRLSQSYEYNLQALTPSWIWFSIHQFRTSGKNHISRI